MKPSCPEFSFWKKNLITNSISLKKEKKQRYSDSTSYSLNFGEYPGIKVFMIFSYNSLIAVGFVVTTDLLILILVICLCFFVLCFLIIRLAESVNGFWFY